MAKAKAKANKKETTLNTYILLDRSGSMSTRWSETLSSINEYVKALDKALSNKITVATFDSHNGFKFEVIRDNINAKKFKPVTEIDATPRGWTPLFDAIGSIVSRAEKDNNEKTILVVMTDGAENASSEVTKDQAKSALDRCRSKKWEVIFLGADFDAMQQGVSVGNSMDKTINMTAGNYGNTMRSMSAKACLYASGQADISFSAQDRDIAIGKKKAGDFQA
jgi:hypothetical protein